MISSLGVGRAKSTLKDIDVLAERSDSKELDAKARTNRSGDLLSF